MNSFYFLFSIIIIKEFIFETAQLSTSFKMQEEEHKIVFVRHAESLSNRAVHNFRE